MQGNRIWGWGLPITSRQRSRAIRCGNIWCWRWGGSKCDPHDFYTSILGEVTIFLGRVEPPNPRQFLRWCTVYSNKHNNFVDFYTFAYILDLFFRILDEDFHLFNTDYISRPVGFTQPKGMNWPSYIMSLPGAMAWYFVPSCLHPRVSVKFLDITQHYRH